MNQAAEYLNSLNKLIDSILEIFPIGSKWYDAAQDDSVTVVGHVRRLGIILTPDNRSGEGTRMGHAELLQGRLIPHGDADACRKRFREYPQEARQAQSEYEAITKGLRMRIWV